MPPIRPLIACYSGGHPRRRLLDVSARLVCVKARMADMNVLMTIAVSGAVLIGQWNEGATVALLYSISNLLESYTMERTRQSLRGLMELAPRDALVRRDGLERRVPVEELALRRCRHHQTRGEDPRGWRGDRWAPPR